MQVLKRVDFGIYLDGEEFGEVLMPAKYVPDGVQVGDWLDGFLYLDSQGRPVVTTQKPLAQAGEMACLEVSWVTSVGAFLAWGLEKDLLLPFSEQTRDLKTGDRVVVYVYVDPRSKRLVATQKWERFMQPLPDTLHEGDAVDLWIAGRTNLGYKAVINGQSVGLLYQNELFSPVQTGQQRVGYIKRIRPDGKVDLSLTQQGYAGVQSESERLLQLLKDKGGFLPTTDKSSPEDIYALCSMSKKTYKKAVGDLYKRRLVELTDKGVKLLDD
ncbi:MAG: GntR family transcriptional regulator [Paludibacteraceae bacterium]|nr:GntR family transcriptional regulator [Paludibacteraceae bacterium]